MKLVTHNVLVDLKSGETTKVVDTALESQPQIAAFQEWNPDNNAILGKRGVMVRGVRSGEAIQRSGEYYVCIGATGLPVLLKTKYTKDIHSVKQLKLANDFNAPAHRPTVGTEVIFTNRFGTKIALLNTHPVAHLDRPEFEHAHKQALQTIDLWVGKAMALDYVPIVMMDGNGLPTIKHLTVCWEGHKKLPTGPGGQTIDGIWTTKASIDVTTFKTPSDHDGVLATYGRI